MDKVNIVVGIIGTLFSITGAIISIVQAKKSKKYARLSETIKNKIINNREISDITKLHSESIRIQNILKKYGPSATEKSLSGVSVQKDAEEIQNLLLTINENRYLFENKSNNINEAIILNTKLTKIIEKFVDATSFTDIKKYGKQMMFLISDFCAVLKNKIDNKNEQIVDE